MRHCRVIQLSILLSMLSLNVMSSEEAAIEDITSKTIDYRVIIAKLEKQYNGENNPIEWDLIGVVGTKTNKLWLRVEGESSGSAVSDSERRLFYSRSLTEVWDFQIGVRHDVQPTPSRSWAQLGLIGIVPGNVATDFVLFFGEGGQMNLRLAGTYVFRPTEKWRITPDLEINFHSQDDFETDIGSGLSDAEFGLRFRYKLTKHFKPYISTVWKATYGQTRQIAESQGEDPNDFRIGIGFGTWF